LIYKEKSESDKRIILYFINPKVLRNQPWCLFNPKVILLIS
jgi:hypothetical protein